MVGGVMPDVYMRKRMGDPVDSKRRALLLCSFDSADLGGFDLDASLAHHPRRSFW